MLSIFSRLLLSAALISVSFTKLSLESATRDHPLPQTHFTLINPGTTVQRLSDVLETGAAQDLTAGRNILQRLLQTNAGSADLWASLGAVYLQSGNATDAKYCYLRAAALAPNSAGTVLNLANYYIRTHQIRSALPLMGRILESETQYSSTVIDDYDTLNLSFDEIAANGGMPPNLRVAQSYFRHLLERKDSVNARKAWDWLKPHSPDGQVAEDYITFLMARGDVNEAAAVWTSQLGTRDPLGTIFDWRVQSDDHVRVSPDGNSLRIDFDGKEHLSYQGVSRRMFLRNGSYKFTALVRTDSITTDEGVGFRVVDAKDSNHPLLETEKLTGTHDWKTLAGTFVVDAPVKQVEIQVFRRPSLKFDNRLGGTEWIGQVSLTRQP